MRNTVLQLCLWSAYCCFATGDPIPLGPEGRLQDEFDKSRVVPTAAKPPVRFNLRTSEDPEHEGCDLSLGRSQPLEDCGFNVTAKTFFIIHGWTGKEDFSLENVHLIGYSLGAHVAGYAGNFVKGTVGRITGLDPAGPLFEGADIHKRLSPDDADFVDVLHTYTRSFGLSIGIQMPVGHIDIYPNGGDFQPGCGLNDVLGSIAYGTIAEVLKCEHERAVHLFVDSLVNQDKPSFAFQCTDSNRFKKGICLSCRKNRCNSIGYNAKKTRNKRNSKMYLKTRAGMPFRVYHYQMKIHVFSYKNMGEMEPTFYVTLYGTNADSQVLPLEMVEQIGLNATNTFLVYTEEDLGDLLKIRLTWEGKSQSWYNLWKELRSYLTQPRVSKQELHIRRIRVKSGETQQKLTFCAEDLENTLISPGQELWFHKCRDGWRMKNETSPTVEHL
nr:endothelial lipase isoform X2 [Ovis aries]